MFKWIYCKDQIPDDDEENDVFVVSFIDRIGNLNSALATYNGYSRPSNKVGVWSDIYTGVYISNVYAWVRLPEPAELKG